jgi:flagellar hook-associated protein 1
MGINSLFNIGTSGITMAQVAIEVTGENIANVNTPGYSRQKTIFETGPVINVNGIPLGTGVRIGEIQRNHDELLQLQLANGKSAYGESQVKQQALEQIEPSFNELTGEGLGQAMEDYFNSLQDLSTNSQGAAERQAVLTRSQILVDNFHQTSSSLQDVVQNADYSLEGITADISDKAKNIASLNNQILQTERLGGNANELRDQRDYMVQQLAEQVGISYAEQSDGTLTVNLSGGQTLVQGSSYGTVSTQVNGATGLNNIMYTPIGGGASVDVTASIGGTDNSLGKIGGTLQVRDEIVPGYIARLDEMANQLVTTVNTIHSSGYGLDGSQNNFFDPAGTTASSIALNTALTGDKIAAAGQNPTTVSGPGDNTNALALAQVKNTTLTFTAGGDSATATMVSYFDTLVSNVGIDAKNTANVTSRNESFLKQLNSVRESNSGVSIDEELTNLVKYQRSYEASARIINVATEMMDTVMGLIR